MDATRYARQQVYSPIQGNYDIEKILDLCEVWEYFNETGTTSYAVLDAFSLEYLGKLDMANLTDTETQDIYRALKGR